MPRSIMGHAIWTPRRARCENTCTYATANIKAMTRDMLASGFSLPPDFSRKAFTMNMNATVSLLFLGGILTSRSMGS